jgi:hypothetical protein
MSYARQLLDTYPRTFNVDAGVLAATIDALNDCAQACTADADDDLSEQNLAELVKCIRLCLDCADVCTATARVTSRQTEYDANLTRPLLEACAATSKSCGDECERHAQMHEHCRVCGRGLPALRAGLPGAAGRHEIADRPCRRALAPHPGSVPSAPMATPAGSSPTWSNTWVVQRNGIRGDKDVE